MTSLWQQYIGIRMALDPPPRCVCNEWMAPNSNACPQQFSIMDRLHRYQKTYPMNILFEQLRRSAWHSENTKNRIIRDVRQCSWAPQYWKYYRYMYHSLHACTIVWHTGRRGWYQSASLFLNIDCIESGIRLGSVKKWLCVSYTVLVWTVLLARKPS